MPKLKRDVHSLTNRNKIYGRQGDAIRIIRKTDHGSIFEVISTGLRASTVHEDIDYEEEGLPGGGAVDAAVGERPAVPPAASPPTKSAKTQKKAKGSAGQPDLFS